MRRALASLLTVGNGRIKAGHLELDIKIGSEEEKRRRFMAPHDNIIFLSLSMLCKFGQSKNISTRYTFTANFR